MLVYVWDGCLLDIGSLVTEVVRVSYCLQCGEDRALGADNLCFDCAKDNKRDCAQLQTLLDKGHTHHCACRLVWGDGECECKAPA